MIDVFNCMGLRTFFAFMVFAITPCMALADNAQSEFDSDNAAYWYQMAYDQYEKPEGFDLGEYADREIELTMEMEMFLREHEHIVEFVIKGSQRKYCDWEYDKFENVLESIPNYTSEAIEIRDLLLANARLQASQNHHEAVLKRWESLFRYSCHINGPQPWCHIIGTSLTVSVYDNIHKYLNEYPDMPSDRLKAIIRLVNEGHQLKRHSLKEVLECFGDFAKTSLTEYKDPIRAELLDGSSVDKILKMNEKGWIDEFCKRNLQFCLEINERNREALKLPYPGSWTAIQKIEWEFMWSVDLEKYTTLPEDFVPTQDDYEDFMEQYKCLFYVLAGPFASLQFYTELKGKTVANAVRTALPLLLDYRKAKQIPENLAADGPKDLFSNKVFVIEKTESGFKLVCQGRDMRESERHEYDFELPKTAEIGR